MTAHPTDKAETLAWLRRISGDLATATIQRLEQSLPWYSEMPPARRSAVGLVAQAGITSFIQWYDDPGSTPWIASDIFAAAPRELLRSVSLQQTLQLIRATVEVTEERVAGKGEDLREGILLYSREVAFAAADVYARAAEARGDAPTRPGLRSPPKATSSRAPARGGGPLYAHRAPSPRAALRRDARRQGEPHSFTGRARAPSLRSALVLLLAGLEALGRLELEEAAEARA